LNLESSIQNLISAIIKRVRTSKNIWCFGNGGSSTTAEHFATDLLLLGTRVGVECKALSLTSQMSTLTAVANDFDYSQTVVRQLRALVSPPDLVIGFSASGNSENIMTALNYCKAEGVETFCFLGFNGGKVLNSGVTQQIFFASEPKLYGLIENLHLMACHYIVDRLLEIDWNTRKQIL